MKTLCIASLAAIALTFGCGPKVDRGELGTILSEPPAFDPHEEKFPLPQLDEAKPAIDSVEKKASAKPSP